MTSEATARKVASAAAKILKSKTATLAEKAVAVSALTQKGRRKKTRIKVASAAAKMLTDPKGSKDTKRIAAALLTQKGCR